MTKTQSRRSWLQRSVRRWRAAATAAVEDSDPAAADTGAEHPHAEGRARRAVIATFAVGAIAFAGLAAVALAQAPPRVLRISAPGIRAFSSPSTERILLLTHSDPVLCQTGESLPAGVSAIRVSIWAFIGAPVRVMAYQGSRRIAEGRRGADWTSDSVTVPVRPLRSARVGLKVCLAIGPNAEPLAPVGVTAPGLPPATATERGGGASRLAADSSRRLPGRMVVEYLAPGRGSWWSRAVSIARRMGLGRAYSGTWIALLVAAMMAVVAALAVRLAIREIR